MAKSGKKKSGVHKNVSSVLKDRPVSSGNGDRPHAEKSPQDHRAEAFPMDTPGGRQSSRQGPTEQRECPNESAIGQGRTGEETSVGSRVVYYHDPAEEEVLLLSLRQRIWEKLFGTKN